jgi:hypothetical protein
MELEKLIGLATQRKHGPKDEEVKSGLHLHIEDSQ